MERTVVGKGIRHALVALATIAGCDAGGPDGGDGEGTEVQECKSLFPTTVSSLQAAPPVQAIAFDFDTGNAPLEVIIPTAIPTIFGAVTSPGDATLILRFTTLITNGWFDAVAPYHPTAVGIYSDLGRRPAGESATNANMNVAIFYASFRVFNSLFPEQAADWDAMMVSVGLDPDDDHEGTGDAIGIGNAAGNALMEARINDGFNQLGNEGGVTYNRRRYADYTGYKPKNTAYKIEDERRWQPRIVVSPPGITRIQHFVTPQMALTDPYSIDPDDFDVPKPEKSYKQGHHGKQKYKAQADEVLEHSANLTDEHKLEAELFNDKIRGLGFSAIFASQSTGMTLMEFVHYDFLTNMAAFDTGIVVWQEKAQWDAVRPFTAIRHIYGDDEVTAWGGPGMGTVNDIPANEWKEYLNVADHPEYPSGSASFCGAHAESSRLFLGSDDLNWTVHFPAGSSQIEPGFTPAADTDLFFPTWTDFETRCGYSRLWAGVHFEDSIVEGIPLGNEIGALAYEFVQAHIDGNPP